jgi:hypothetical protein
MDKDIQFPENDKKILRELAKAYRELSEKEVNSLRIKRSIDTHNLKPVRPLVWIHEIPWNEMDINGELKLKCVSEESRKMEEIFRQTLFRWKYFQADMVVEDTYYIQKTFTDSGIGMGVKEKIIPNKRGGDIVSHQFEDQLDSEDKVEELLIPVIKAFPEKDKNNLQQALEVLDGILPVKLRGDGIYYAPWDFIARLRGVENCLVDMLDNPSLIHKIMEKFTQIGKVRIDQMEKLGLLDFNVPNVHCTPPYTDILPAKDYDGKNVRLKDVWFRAMAQLFSAASPAMLEEFDLFYTKPLMEKGGLGYYGCCEPLDKAIPYLKKIKNLRKIGVSPWADVRSSARQMGGDYVFARKPNPALVASVFNKEAVEKETVETIEACMENKCPYEFVLKDISTVGGKPQNLIDWTKTVISVIDRYYS